MPFFFFARRNIDFLTQLEDLFLFVLFPFDLIFDQGSDVFQHAINLVALIYDRFVFESCTHQFAFSLNNAIFLVGPILKLIQILVRFLIV